MAKRVVIVGAGIIGASLAHSLTRAGAEVVVAERAGPASGATGKSFGWINSNLTETKDYHRLRVAGIKAWRDLGEDPGDEPLVRWGGSLSWEDGDAAIDEQQAAMRRFGYDARLVDRDGFSALEPEVANPPARCLHCVDEGAVDPARAARALLDRAAKAGAERLIGCEVTGLLRDGERIVGVETTFGPLVADMVVLAAGAESAALAESAGVRLPLTEPVGLLLETAPLRSVLTHIVLTPEIHFRQEPDGRIIAGEIFSGGGESADGIDVNPRGLAALILDKLRRRLPGVEGISAGAVRLGRRPTPVDGMPIVGDARGAPGLYVAVMHSGVTLGPLIGTLAAAEIVEGATTALLAPFRPGRFN
ncbi:MAG: FAD-binding oxidoreductase [Pseudomonadota bacterium]